MKPLAIDFEHHLVNMRHDLMIAVFPRLPIALVERSIRHAQDVCDDIPDAPYTVVGNAITAAIVAVQLACDGVTAEIEVGEKIVRRSCRAALTATDEALKVMQAEYADWHERRGAALKSIATLYGTAESEVEARLSSIRLSESELAAAA